MRWTMIQLRQRTNSEIGKCDRLRPQGSRLGFGKGGKNDWGKRALDVRAPLCHPVATPSGETSTVTSECQRDACRGCAAASVDCRQSTQTSRTGIPEGGATLPKRKAVCEEEEGGQEDGPPCSQTLPFDMHIQSRHTFRLENSPPSSPEGKYEPRGCWKEHPGFPLGLQQRCNHRPGRSPLPGRGGCPQEGRDRQASACSRQAPSKTTKRGCFQCGEGF